MRKSIPTIRFLMLSLAFGLGSCLNDAGDGKKTVTGNHAGMGTFKVNLVAPTDFSQGYTSVTGRINTGKSPDNLIWEPGLKSGNCQVLTPRVPFCETPCGGNAACVEDGQCMDYPKGLNAGKITVTGMKTKAGAMSFVMNPLLFNYQVPSGTTVDFPPFSEGDPVTFSAAGDSAVGTFIVSAKGIAPLDVLNDSLVQADGQPLLLKWTPAAQPSNSTVSVLVDISHHGGTKGKIICETPDTGQLEIAAALMDKLKSLGVAGYPKVELTRKATGSNAEAHIDLLLESMVYKGLTIPGVISCFEDLDCPTGQTCQQDAQCK